MFALVHMHYAFHELIGIFSDVQDAKDYVTNIMERPELVWTKDEHGGGHGAKTPEGIMGIEPIMLNPKTYPAL